MTATAQAAPETTKKDSLSFEEIDVNPWIREENTPHLIEVSLVRGGLSQAMHFTQSDAIELRNQITEALSAIEAFKQLTAHPTTTAIMIGQ